MSVYNVILQRRSIRKFLQVPIDTEIIERLVDAARNAPSGANLQPMKYLSITDVTLIDLILPNIKWASHIHPAHTPARDECPVAFICCLCDKEIKQSGWDTDAGAAISAMLIAAAGEGIGSCWLGAINREMITNALKITERFHLHSMVALGFAAESPVVENEHGSIKYYEDEYGILHVPKRKIEDVLFINKIDLQS